MYHQEQHDIKRKQRVLWHSFLILVYPLYVDPDSDIAGMSHPTAECLFKMGHESEKVYQKYQFDTTCVYFGRSSFDGEASLEIGYIFFYDYYLKITVN